MSSIRARMAAGDGEVRLMPYASGRGTPPKYYPLQQYLAPQSGDTITLTFTDIEQIIDAPLPRTAQQRT